MKKQQLNEIKNKSIKDLKTLVNSLKKEIANLNMDLKLGKLKNVRAISAKRKDVAQVLTIVNQNAAMEKIKKEKENA
jgi:large subunit ribosomal protein L29